MDHVSTSAARVAWRVALEWRAMPSYAELAGRERCRDLVATYKPPLSVGLCSLSVGLGPLSVVLGPLSVGLVVVVVWA